MSDPVIHVPLSKTELLLVVGSIETYLILAEKLPDQGAADVVKVKSTLNELKKRLQLEYRELAKMSLTSN